MVFIAFDFGTMSWGVAVGDSLSQTAEAIGAVQAQKGDPVWSDIEAMVNSWGPEGIVIGYPLKANGERFKITDKVDEAIRRLKAHYPNLPLHRADEHLTTVAAKEALYAKKGHKGLAKGNIDAESARLILLGLF